VFPNPFRPGTAVGQSLKFENIPSDSEIKIFTVSGELVRSFTQVSGRVLWDGRNSAGSDVASGVYLYIINTSTGERVTGKIFVVR
jgi:hypothetical protein